MDATQHKIRQVQRMAEAQPLQPAENHLGLAEGTPRKPTRKPRLATGVTI